MQSGLVERFAIRAVPLQGESFPCTTYSAISLNASSAVRNFSGNPTRWFATHHSSHPHA